MKNLNALLLISLLVLTTGNLFSQKKSDVKPEGTWTFTSQDVPYEYSKGNLLVTRESKELRGEIVFSEYNKVKVQDLILEDNVLTFKAYIEVEMVNVKGEITGDEMKGTATSSEGTVTWSAKRKQE